VSVLTNVVYVLRFIGEDAAPLLLTVITNRAGSATVRACALDSLAFGGFAVTNKVPVAAALATCLDDGNPEISLCAAEILAYHEVESRAVGRTLLRHIQGKDLMFAQRAADGLSRHRIAQSFTVPA